MTTAECAGAVGVEADHLGCSAADLREHVDEVSWSLLARYLRGLAAMEAEGLGWLVDGPTGTGKTATLALLVEGIIRHHGEVHEPQSEATTRGITAPRPRVIIVSETTIADHFSRRDKSEAWEAVKTSWELVRHLVIDDLGSAHWEAWASNGWYDLINGRSKRQLSTHASLNVDPSVVAVGPNAARIRSRLLQRSFQLTMTGADRRVRVSPRRLLDLDF